MPGLRCDNYTRPTAAYDIAELFQYEGSAVQVYLEDRRRRRLRGRDTGSMDEPGDVAKTCGRLDERVHGLSRGYVDHRDAHIVSGVPHDLPRGIGVVLTQIRQQDVRTCTDPTGDRLTDLTRSDYDNYVSQSYSSHE